MFYKGIILIRFIFIKEYKTIAWKRVSWTLTNVKIKILKKNLLRNRQSLSHGSDFRWKKERNANPRIKKKERNNNENERPINENVGKQHEGNSIDLDSVNANT